MAKLFEKKGNGKYDGLNEAQRLQLKQFEVEKEKKLKASQKRMEENLPAFKEDYSDLVEKYGIKHTVRLVFREGTPEWLRVMITSVCGSVITLTECREEVDEINKEKDTGVVKPD